MKDDCTEYVTQERFNKIVLYIEENGRAAGREQDPFPTHSLMDVLSWTLVEDIDKQELRMNQLADFLFGGGWVQ